MSEKCPKCGADMVSYGPRSDHGEHELGGISCLERQLAAALAENMNLRAAYCLAMATKGTAMRDDRPGRKKGTPNVRSAKLD